MNITEKQFFNECLDLSIPELARAAELFNCGDKTGAESAFATYIKKTIKPSNFFKIPFSRAFDAISFPGENLQDMADRIIDNVFISCKIPHDFGKGNKIDWSANPTYNAYKEWVVQFHRHHEWAILGYVYLETKDEKYAAKFAELINSWITEALQCPLPGDTSNNLHWRTLECGIRLARNWNPPIHACINSPAISDSLWFLFLCRFASRLAAFMIKGLVITGL